MVARGGGLDQYHIYTASQKRQRFVTKATALWRTILEIFGEHVAKKVSNQMVLYFSPHLTSASALPGETENRKITHLFTLTLNVVMPRDTENTFILSLGHR